MMKPVQNGPMKLPADRPMAIQLKTFCNSTRLLARRPTCRCRAISALPVAPPHSSAVRQSTGKTGQIAARPVPMMVNTTLKVTGWRSVCRSA